MEFTPGIELSRRFHAEAVRPILRRARPRLRYTAALLGPGSEVLGFDSPRSTDHDWGPRLLLFPDGDGAGLRDLLADHLPRTFLGYSTHFVTSENGTRHLAQATGRTDHGVVVAGLGDWVRGTLGFDPRRPVRADWLATPTQIFAEFTGGAVFHDDLGLETLRRNLAWYPGDVWRYVLACQWQRIGQEEAFVGRCGEAGDELGSAVVAARLVRDLMRLCLLMARRYPPYSKWLGSAFARLPVATRLAPHLTGALAATTWQLRERHLVAAYECVAGLHNDLGLTEPVVPRTSGYHDRPFQVIHAGRFVTPLLAGWPPAPLTGAIDQFVDSTDALGDRAFTRGVVDCPHG
ncbi:DUF4037 domain-containing protein [Amycolatopsis vancoresmycina]|uniref:DUF4037 domain-containing protein n=1 Tax=Amycolatopsis vancoresmycina DSM 44592 TaxID=1292037 RepID=R1I456_9PSEU|nr:DUF4037 domain-containing protein [Amycolatopsis vancoresmycina]EOD70540.1 hypothetical protein H480_00545 [Amycolatopsis vancoresmycina DSM 44592]